jgi:hypothetical protein
VLATFGDALPASCDCGEADPAIPNPSIAAERKMADRIDLPDCLLIGISFGVAAFLMHERLHCLVLIGTSFQDRKSWNAHVRKARPEGIKWANGGKYRTGQNSPGRSARRFFVAFSRV